MGNPAPVTSTNKGTRITIIYNGIEARTIPELLALLANTEPEPKNESPRADQNGNTDETEPETAKH